MVKRNVNYKLIVLLLIIFLILVVHITWLYSSIKWTDKTTFIITFYMLLIPSLLILLTYSKNIIYFVLIGVLIGSLANYLGSLLSYAISRPERLEIFFNSFELTWNYFKINFMFFPTITGAWIIGGLLASLFFNLKYYDVNLPRK